MRPLLLTTAAVLTVGSAAGGSAYVADRTAVTLTVDGVAQRVTTRGDRVGDVLATAGLRLGEHDVLVPAADRELVRGGTVALRRGRELRLQVDGVARTVWVTAGDVDEALAQIGMRVDGSFLSASRSREIGLDGLSLEVRLPKQVTVVADGASTSRTTTAATVADLLAEAAVVLRPQDTVEVPLTAPVTPGLVVTVRRVDSAQVVQDLPIPYPVSRAPDPAAPVGTERVVRAGTPGVERRTYTVTLVDGVETGRVLASTVRAVEPVAQTVAVGSRPKPTPAPPPAPPPPAAPPAGGSGLNWAALARCESGGNPSAVSGNGLYFGLYQFSVATWRGVGGSGLPSQASPAEQTSRAQLLYSRAGRSPWPVCGRYL